MKRKAEASYSEENKKIRCNATELPLDIWQSYIINILDFPSRLALSKTASFFNHAMHESIFRDFIRANIFDFADENALVKQIKLPLNADKCISLFDKFNAERQKITILSDEANTNYFEVFTEDLQKILFDAIKTGNMVVLKKLELFFPEFMQGYHSTLYFEGTTALGLSALYGRKTFFYALLNIALTKYYTPFALSDYTAQEAHTLQHHILSEGFLSALTPLHIIGFRSDTKWLLEIFEQYPETLNDVFLTDDYQLALQYILKNDFKTFQKLLDTNKEKLESQSDIADWNLLHWACNCLQATNFVQAIIDKKPDINMKKISPLFIACAAGNLSALHILVSNGLPIKPHRDGTTCLHIAANHGRVACMQYLIDNKCGQDMHAVNDANQTPLTLLGKWIEFNKEDLSPAIQAQRTQCIEFMNGTFATLKPDF